jgi:hypothetical protein
MDIDRFRKLIENPDRTQAELEQMMRNAIARNNNEFARLAKEMLDLRFPGWDKLHHKDSRARPTVAMFQGESVEFPTSKGAYVWLIEKFIAAKPELFRTVNWETAFVAKGRNRNYFGRTPERMFHGSPHLARDRNNYALLTNGWYANLNLSNDQKQTVLIRFGVITNLEYGNQWSWEVLD